MVFPIMWHGDSRYSPMSLWWVVFPTTAAWIHICHLTASYYNAICLSSHRKVASVFPPSETGWGWDCSNQDKMAEGSLCDFQGSVIKRMQLFPGTVSNVCPWNLVTILWRRPNQEMPVWTGAWPPASNQHHPPDMWVNKSSDLSSLQPSCSQTSWSRDETWLLCFIWNPDSLKTWA